MNNSNPYRNNNDNNSVKNFYRSVSNNKMTSNHLKESRDQTKPYQHGKSQVNGAESSKLAPIFIRTVNCKSWLISDSRFVVNPSEFHSKLIDVFKTIPSKAYDANTKLWSFSISDYKLLHSRCAPLKPYVIIEEIPANVLKLCLQPKEELDFSCLKSIEPKLAESLLPFQKEGVCFAISKQGKVLIADEMGLGKTYQALAIADFYKDDLPLLICTTVSTRDSWINHIKNLLPIACHHVKCLASNHDYVSDAKILITSYSMLEKHIEMLLQIHFGIVIFDESHTLKNKKAKCTMMADRLAKQAKRIILVSGTPALSRPLELFTQLKMLDRSFFNFMDFTKRYCDGKQTNFGWNATGQSNLQELNVVLNRKYMIRRVKADVLPELAEKFRETVILDSSKIKTDLKNLDSFTESLSQCKDGRKKEEILINFYAETAKIKKDAVCDYIQNLIKKNNKFIVFAHHSIMLNAICDRLDHLGTDYIRIDGSTRNDIRTAYINRFQRNKSCQVAVLSLKACNAGITLTAADLIIFAELDWNPSTMAQAESRAHRIGQEAAKVTCRYLLANKTADDIIWKILKNKQDTLTKTGIFCENLQNSTCLVGPASKNKNLNKIDKYFLPNKDQKPGESETKENKPVNDKNNEREKNEINALLNDSDEIFCDFEAKENQSVNNKSESPVNNEREKNEINALLNDSDEIFCDFEAKENQSVNNQNESTVNDEREKNEINALLNDSDEIFCDIDY